MARLGSPHGRGSGQPKAAKLTWHDVWDGCTEAGCVLLGIPVALLGAGLFLFGIFVAPEMIGRWIMGNDLLARLTFAVFGAVCIGVAVLGLIGIARGRVSGTPAAQLALAVVVLILLAAMGIGALYGACTYEAPGSTF